MEISSLVDPNMIQYLQDHFCKGNNLYMFCLDKDYQVITKEYGDERDLEYLHQLVSADYYDALIEKIKHSRIENVVEEFTECDFVKLCAVAITVSGQAQITWIITSLIEDYMVHEDHVPDYIMCTREENFYRTIEFLSMISRQFFAAKMGESIAQEAMRESVASEKAMEIQLRRSEAMTEILRLLESEKDFHKIIDDILQEVCTCLNIYVGTLLQENSQGGVDMICEYCTVPQEGKILTFQNVPKSELPYFNGKSYMISTDTELSLEFEEFFQKQDLTAGIFFPILDDYHSMMYLCFCHRKDVRNWEMEEIQFINDVKHIVQGIFSKRVAKDSLASSYAALNAILENAGCGIYVVDQEQEQILYTNQRFKELFARTMERGRLEEMIFAQRNIEKSAQEIYISLEERWVDMNRTRIQWVDGRKVCLGTVYDVTDKKNYQKKIESQANNDFLTGLYNRMRCEEDLKAAIHQAVLHKEEGALIYIDLDDFKHINDGLGHQYGDVLLKEISQSIRRIRGVENNCYRMGGDEFIVIIQDDYFYELNRICNDIRKIFQRPWFLKGEDYYCTISMGITCFPTDAGTVDEVIRNADLALLAAKSKGRNRVEFYNGEDANAPYRRLDLEKNMRKATMNACAEFEVYYQPVVDITREGNPCCGAEALARWNSEELGFISPGDFIPIAEYLGLINPIGEHILMKAARQCKKWNDMGHPDYKVNVNLSVIQLLQNDIVKKIKQVLDVTRINPKNLRLEVTESLAINDIDRMKMILSQIKELGVGVALDDFGTGYSSLNHIRELPVDVIKIDRCFVEHIAEDDFSESFVKMVAELACAIDVEICVEGVENTQQYNKIKESKIQMIQGYYFGKPMKTEEFEAAYL